MYEMCGVGRGDSRDVGNGLWTEQVQPFAVLGMRDHLRVAAIAGEILSVG
jgi:hypothetical protein